MVQVLAQFKSKIFVWSIPWSLQKKFHKKIVQKLVQSCHKFLVVVLILPFFVPVEIFVWYIPKIYQAFINMNGVYEGSFTKNVQKLVQSRLKLLVLVFDLASFCAGWNFLVTNTSTRSQTGSKFRSIMP